MGSRVGCLSRRGLVGGLGTLAGTGLLAACSASGRAKGSSLSSRPTALRTGVKVTVLNDVNQATVPAFDQLLATWKSAHAGTDVEWIRPQGAVSLAAMMTAGTPPRRITMCRHVAFVQVHSLMGTEAPSLL